MDMWKEKPISVREVAEHFGVTPRTVRRWFSAGLEHIQIGGRLLTTKGAVGRFSTDRSPTHRHLISTPSADLAELLAKHGRPLDTV